MPQIWYPKNIRTGIDDPALPRYHINRQDIVVTFVDFPNDFDFNERLKMMIVAHFKLRRLREPHKSANALVIYLSPRTIYVKVSAYELPRPLAARIQRHRSATLRQAANDR